MLKKLHVKVEIQSNQKVVQLLPAGILKNRW